jgi:hypothetical protein
MSLKMLLLIVLTCLVLFALLLVYALSPAIRNVTGKKVLQPFVNTPLSLQRTGYLYKLEQGQYDFYPISLSENVQQAVRKSYALPVGTSLRIKQFKTYKNAVSGFTHLYALGQVTTATGEKVAFQYDWGSIDAWPHPEQGVQLAHAPWQQDDEPLVFWDN